MTQANHAAVLAYATAYLAYDSGTSYGQSGDHPLHDGLTAEQADLVRVLVQKGKQVALAQRDRDEARERFFSGDLEWGRRRWRGAGLPVDAFEVCYGLGYGAVGR